MKVLLDEHLSPVIARLLRDLGHDVVAVADRSDLSGLADLQLWALATRERRAIVTENVRDYAPLARTAAAAGGGHSGLVLISPRTFPRRRESTGRLVAALDRLVADHPGDALRDRTVWLTPPDADEAAGR